MLKYVTWTGSKRPRVQQASTETSSSDEGLDVSVVYICELPEVKGRFDIEKARKFFSRPGPHYGLLQSGKSVMSSDGITMPGHVPASSEGQCTSCVTLKSYLSTSVSCVRLATRQAPRSDSGHEAVRGNLGFRVSTSILQVLSNKSTLVNVETSYNSRSENMGANTNQVLASYSGSALNFEQNQNATTLTNSANSGKMLCKVSSFV